MAVSNTSNRSPATGGYACNGSVTEFTGSFRLLAEADVQVILTNSSGAESTLALTTDYTVTPTDGSYPTNTFSVTTTSTYASGYTITLIRSMDATQPKDLNNSGPFYPNEIETGLDRNTLLIQQVQEELNRSVKVPASSTVDPDTLWSDFQDGTLTAVAYTSEKLLTNYATLADAVTTIGSTETTLVIDKDDTLTANVTVPSTMNLRFVNGNMVTTSTYTLTVNGVIDAGRYQIFNDTGGTVNGTPLIKFAMPEWFGAAHDGTTDDKTKIQSACDFHQAVLFSDGNYRIASGVSITTANQYLVGTKDSIISAEDGTFNMFTITSADGVVFDNITFYGGAVSGTSSHGIISGDSNPSDNVTVRNCVFSGPDTTTGLNTAVKIDTCTGWLVTGCRMERLFGQSGADGYGVLMGAATNCVITNNHMVGSKAAGLTARHGVYLSAGTSDCVVSNNYIDGFDFAGITQYATAAQDSCSNNIISHNVVKDCCFKQTATDAGIGVYGNSIKTSISGNHVIGSDASGIVVSCSSIADGIQDVIVCDNIIDDSRLFGMDIAGAARCTLDGNKISASSQASSTTYPNIRLINDNSTTGCDEILVIGNHSTEGTGATVSRSPFQINNGAPAPTNVRLIGNYFPTFSSALKEELNGVECEIDGRLQFSTTWDPANLADGASVSQGFTVTGADQGDIVTVGHTSNIDGMNLTGYTSATNTVTVVLSNHSGGAKDVASGTLFIDVWKRLR